ncbi:acyltransferase family protein [Thermodesulfobacteriota bacterium]
MRHFDSLHGLKSVAILLVVFSHLPNEIPFLGQFGIGANGVSIFILLSGFLVTHKHITSFTSDTNPFKWSVSYLKKKINKFYFLHFLTFLAASVFVIQELFLSFSFKYLINSFVTAVLNLLLLQSFVPVRSVYFSFNPTSWYLSAVMFFYFATPFILLLILKFRSIMGKILMCCGIFIFQIACTLALSESQYAYAILYVNPLFRVLEFALGCFLGILFLEMQKKLTGAGYKKSISFKYSLMEICAFILFVLAILAWPYIPEAFRYCVFYIPFTAFLIYSFAFNKGILSFLFTNPVMLFAGHISLEIFLIHFIVIKYLHTTNRILGEIPDWVFIILVLVITFSLSYLVHLSKDLFKRKII